MPKDWEEEIRRFEEQDRVDPPPPGAFVFVGSSSITQWDTLAQDFAPAPVIRRGFGGSRLADSVKYAPRIVIPYRPRKVLLYAGGNDLNAGESPEKVFADFVEFVRVVHGALPQTTVSYLGLKPSPAHWDKIDAVRKTNAMVEQYAGAQENVEYIDLHTPLLREGEPPPARFFLPDRNHLSREGYAVWIEVIRPYLR